MISYQTTLKKTVSNASPAIAWRHLTITSNFKNGEAVGCDILVVAVGVRPNVRLAESAGISINKGIVTNENMQTSNPDIYAAGDCVESFDITDGSKRILALWPNAVRQGIIAGSHMAGGAEPAEKGTMPLNSVGFFSLNVMTCGITDPRDNSYETIIKTEGQKYKVCYKR